MDGDIRSKYQNIEDYSTILKVDEFGFVISPSTSDLTENNVFNAPKTEWSSALEFYQKNLKKFKLEVRTKRLLQTNIPSALRSRIWSVFLLKESSITHFTNRYNNSINLFCKKFLLHDATTRSEIKFKSLKLKASKYEYQIHVDVQRTFRQHYLFYKSFGKGQLELFNLLVAFANSFKEVGYCQGMSDIAAIFLIHYAEGEAFEMMCKFFKSNNLDKIFDKNFSKLPQILKLQKSMLLKLLPTVYNHLLLSMDSLGMCFVSWYLTLFTRFPIKLTLRIWDFMMCYGTNVIVYFVCAILFVQKKEILSKSGESLLIYFNRLHEISYDENKIVYIVDIAVKFIEELNYSELQSI